MSVHRAIVAGLCVAVGALAFSSAPVSAAVTHTYFHKYLYQLKEFEISEITVDSAGDFYGRGGSRVERLDSAGSPLAFSAAEPYVEGSRLTGTPTGPSEEVETFGVVRAVAVDDKTGEVYAADAYTKVVDVFSSSGEYLSRLTGTPPSAPVSGPFNEPNGLAVDQATGELYVLDPQNKVVDVFNSADEYVSQFGGGALLVHGVDIAVSDSTGDVYVAESNPPFNSQVDVFGSSGNFIAPAWNGSGTPPGSFEEDEELHVAVDQSSGHVYLSSGGPETQNDFVDEFGASSSEEYLDQLPGTPAGPFVRPTDVAVAPSSGDVYVADAGGVLDVFGPDVVAPDVTIDPISNLGTASATLNATVNPNGVAAESCQFEYGVTESFGFTVPCSPAPGSGSSPVQVSANVTGLALDAAYHYRLAVTPVGGPTSYGPVEDLVTTPAVEGSAHASDVTSFAATLTGVLQAREVTPSYHFAYGLTNAYGSSWPQPEANAGANSVQTVSQTVTGLQPDTTYHFALVTSNYGGGETYGPDATFTTRPLVPPAVSTGAAEAIGQTTATLTGAVDPEGLQTTYRFEYGPTTAYGSIWPLIPVSAGSANTGQGVAVAVPNLQPGTTYHYRLVATNEDGTTYGADQAFTTSGYPVSVVQETPVLSTKLGFVNPEAGKSPGKASKPKGHGKGKARKKGKHRKAKPRKKGKRKG